VAHKLTSLSRARSATQQDVSDLFEVYVAELLEVYKKNADQERALKAKAEEAMTEENEGVDKKKAKKNKKAGSTEIQFGKGTRKFFDYLQLLETECGGFNEIFKKKLGFFTNRELQSIVREIGESSN
jgi:hypothetical protein